MYSYLYREVGGGRGCTPFRDMGRRCFSVYKVIFRPSGGDRDGRGHNDFRGGVSK